MLALSVIKSITVTKTNTIQHWPWTAILYDMIQFDTILPH